MHGHHLVVKQDQHEVREVAPREESLKEDDDTGQKDVSPPRDFDVERWEVDEKQELCWEAEESQKYSGECGDRPYNEKEDEVVDLV